MIHIAFVKPKTAQYIIDGSQTCESRLSKVRHPARLVTPGDLLLIKAGDGRAVATVSRVEIYESLRPLDIEPLQDLYAKFVDGPHPDPNYWHGKRDSRYAVFMWLSDVHFVFVPRRLLPSTQSAWINDFQPTSEILSHLRAEGSDSNRQPSCWKQAALPIAPLPR